MNEIQESDFETLGEYYEYPKQNKIITLKGETVKSFEECEIANFLSLQGVNYEYEAAYEHSTADETHRQYQPDFYLPDQKIYIEHFGIDHVLRGDDQLHTEYRQLYRANCGWRSGHRHGERQRHYRDIHA